MPAVVCISTMAAVGLTVINNLGRFHFDIIPPYIWVPHGWGCYRDPVPVVIYLSSIVAYLSSVSTSNATRLSLAPAPYPTIPFLCASRRRCVLVSFNAMRREANKPFMAELSSEGLMPTLMTMYTKLNLNKKHAHLLLSQALG